MQNESGCQISQSSKIPKYNELIAPVFIALKELGGSGTNDEILDQVINDLSIPDEIADIPHSEKSSWSELSYRLTWARSYLSKYGAIKGNGRSVWAITPEYLGEDFVDANEVVAAVLKKRAKKENEADPASAAEKMTELPQDKNSENDDEEFPDEIKPWREKLMKILQEMNAYGFERLARRVLRECGFSEVEVTKGSHDGGIDGTGKLNINGVFSFNIAFQCKRYSGLVGAPEIRNFRGSLPVNIERGIFITTGGFSKAAREEASNPGKMQIDLLDGEELINKLVEYEIGVHPVTTYSIDEEFFKKI